MFANDIVLLMLMQVYLGTSNGSIFVLDVHNGTVVAQVQIAPEDSILELTWNCPRFKMEEPSHPENNVARSSTGSIISETFLEEEINWNMLDDSVYSEILLRFIIWNSVSLRGSWINN